MSERDGGPAFPETQYTEKYGKCRPIQMPNGEVLWEHFATGMTLRDWFAGQALVFLAHPARVGVFFDAEGDAQFAYAVADAMLKERDR